MNNSQRENDSTYTLGEIAGYYNTTWAQDHRRSSRLGWGYEQKRIHQTIFEFLRIRDGDRVLEIGCGKGDLTRKLSGAFAELIAFDISPIGVDKARQHVDDTCDCHFLLSDATTLPFRTNSFDVVVLSEVLEHVLDQERCIQEIHRVTRPGGRLMLTTPNTGGLHRNTQRLIHMLLRRSFIPRSSQIIDNPLPPSIMEQMLQTHFMIEKKRGVLYTLPYLGNIGWSPLINLSNWISESIEQRNLLPSYGLYQCFLCCAIKPQ